MGLDGIHTWFMELVVHKGYKPTDDQLFSYGFTDEDELHSMHGTLGCLLSHEGRINYWRSRTEGAKRKGDIEGVKFSMMILSKYIRGIYR